MFTLKYFVVILVLCEVNGIYGKPVEYNFNEGRGIGSTLWGWLTYPFSWWSSGNDILPESDQLIKPTSPTPFETIEIGRHNVTIWCNDQTCTTMRCDKFGCVNITCNIYDTDLNGECRQYNTIVKPEDPTSQKPVKATEPAAKPTVQDKETRTTVKPPESTIAVSVPSTATTPNQAVDERPLELEAVLSSTVTEVISQPTQTIKPNN
ncbi:uncharacterized protein [Epargyreus clarus]|uniref:uncharacterized protein n=1 Tax=Epargyreus clarus TaxID=520877 RepID=UPI003C2DC30C